ncbi:MAG: hypothetical protein AMXMBFR13_46770 [Phycisphaerae bacterium]
MKPAVQRDSLPPSSRCSVRVAAEHGLPGAQESQPLAETVPNPYRTILEHIPAITYVAIADDQSSTLFISPQVEPLLGIPAQEFLSNPVLWYEHLHPDDRGRVMAELEHCRQTGEPLRIEYRMIGRDGNLRWFRDEATFCRDDAGHPATMQGIMLDITDHKAVQENLRRTQARSQALLDTAPDAIICIDEQGHIESFNPAAEELFGYTIDEVMSRGVECILPALAEGRTAFFAREECSNGHLPISGRGAELTGIHKDGSTFPVDIAVGGVRLGSRQLYTAFVRDLSDRRVLNEQLFRAQKLEAVGRLAGGVAHDFNNFLTVLSCNLDLLSTRLGQHSTDTVVNASLEQMTKAWQGARDLTRQLLAFSRRQVAKPELLDVNAVIRDAMPMIQSLVGRQVRIRAELQEGAGLVRMDAGQIEQVLMNLAANSRDAMPEGGELVIRTSRDVLRTTQAVISGHASGACILLSVSDTGVGMDQEVLDHIFEPFFTTKPIGQGTGLGLPTIYAIVQQVGGQISVQSREGEGTTLQIFLPLAREGARPHQSLDRPRQPAGGSETILVCEDEPMILNLAARILQGSGYQVLAAESPTQAIWLAASHAGGIDLLITDVMMPEMNGRRLAETLSARFSKLRVLFMSGYTADIICEEGVLHDGIELLEKPFNPAALLDRVRELLDRVPIPFSA